MQYYSSRYVAIEKWKMKVILLRVFPNRIYENDRELRMVAHWFAEGMTRAIISTVWDKWPQALSF